MTKESIYLHRAMSFARKFSKDRSTQAGAMFLQPQDFGVLTKGYNGLPRGCDDTAPERQERPLKYSYFEHAERNAIYNCVRGALRDSVAVYVGPVDALSMDDVRAIISVGAKGLYLQEPLQNDLARMLLEEAGVHVMLRRFPVRKKLQAYAENLLEDRDALCKDPVAPNAAEFLHPTEYTSLTSGYSGLLRGADDSRRELFEAPEREFWVESGVRNAIYNVARNLLKGSTLVVGPLPPCSACARAILAVGAKKVVALKPSADLVDRWGAHFERTREMFRVFGIEYEEVPEELLG
jgi:dCMP deaminase